MGIRNNLFQASPWALIVAAAVLHLALATAIYVAGRTRISSSIQADGVVLAIAPDAAGYVCDAEFLADLLRKGEFRSWYGSAIGIQAKFYSISFAVLSPWLGINSLCAEPVNLLLYLLALILTFQLGLTVFNREIGLLAACALALWPSFLLHSTQLLKDQFFIVSILVLVLIMTHWLTKPSTLSMGLVTGAAGSIAGYVIGRTRSGYWIPLLAAIILIGIALLVARQFREKTLLPAHLLSAILIILGLGLTFSATVNERFGVVRSPLYPPTAPPVVFTPPEPVANLTLEKRIDLAAIRIWQIRYDYILAEGPAGTMDSDVVFYGARDIAMYLPRAAMIGFFAPFPNQWFMKGRQTGTIGRIVGAMEMAAAYIIDGLALLGLWRSRKSLSAWLLVCVSLLGVSTIALVVMNMGALFRMRYVFLILLFPLAAQGLMQVVPVNKNSQTTGLMR